MKKQYIKPIVEVVNLKSVRMLATSGNSTDITYGGSNADEEHNEADSKSFFGPVLFDDTEE